MAPTIQRRWAVCGARATWSGSQAMTLMPLNPQFSLPGKVAKPVQGGVGITSSSQQVTSRM